MGLAVSFEFGLNLATLQVELKQAIQASKPSFKDIDKVGVLYPCMLVHRSESLSVLPMDSESVASIELEDCHELAVWRDISHVWKEQPHAMFSVLSYRVRLAVSGSGTLYRLSPM